MRGKYGLNWVFDWLGLGSMGQDYEVLETVQPVMAIDPFQYPLFRPNYANIGFAMPAGPSAVNLPDPVNPDGTRNTKLARIWLELELSRTAVTVNDRTTIRRFDAAGQGYDIGTWTEDLVAAGTWLPLIGGVRFQSPGGGATRASYFGRKPVYVAADDTLQINFNNGGLTTGQLTGRFVDVNASAPVPFDFLY